MNTQPTPDDLEALARKHGATSYRNRADTQHPAYGFTEDGLRNLLADAIAQWGTPATGGKPVAYLIDWPDEPELGHYFAETPTQSGRSQPLYTSPQPVREPLSVPEINDMMRDAGWQNSGIRQVDLEKVVKVVRLAEAAHGITGGQHGTQT